MRRFRLALLSVPLAVVLSSCFVLQGFVVRQGALAPGQKTSARFQLRPVSTDNLRFFQFVLIGIDTDELRAGRATWGVNRKFGGPLVMPVYPGLAGAISGSCTSNGLDFDTITGVTWKGYVTPKRIRTRGLVDQKAVVDVALRVKNAATSGQLNSVVGVTGSWNDDGDGIVTGGEIVCTGISTSSLYVT